MQPEARKLLSDALEAANAVAEFSRARDFDQFKADLQFRSAIYWQFAIVGEALSQLRRIDAVVFASVTEADRIVAFRNQIVHGYGLIQDNITWQII